MRQYSITHVGLDVHARTIAVAMADDSGDREVRFFGEIAHTPEAVERLVGRLVRPDRELVFWYEAGPCGYGLHRQLTTLGHRCVVVAPSLIPRRPGDRIKTDRRDAMSLARLGRAGELTAVWVPGEADEAMRDLTRYREDVKAMQRTARQQLSGFLLRHGRHFADGSRWTQKHHAWLTGQRFDQPVHETVYQHMLGQVDQLSAQIDQLDAAIRKAAEAWSLWPVAQGLMAMRGVDLIAAVTILAELGDLTRFDSPGSLMKFLGLTPGEHSSGETRRRGPITKAGNRHVRRILVESAWSYRFTARKTKHIQSRARHAPASVQAIAWKAQKRLCGRYRHLVNDLRKKSVVACTAIARELCGFVWAIAQEIKRLEPGESSGESSPRL